MADRDHAEVLLRFIQDARTWAAHWSNEHDRRETEAAASLAALTAENERLRGLANALEADERHGNLQGRAEDAWYVYVAALAAGSEGGGDGD